jgi:threonine/homoserine/homoserine lactone efflux protein
MSFEQILAFAVFVVVTAITPGPNNVMLTATGANVGIRRGLPHLFGVTFGFALMMFLVAAGAGSALLANPSFMQVIRYVGIATLLWLAWKIATSGAPESTGGARPVSFLEAAVFQWVNPKAWLMCGAAVSGYLQTESVGALPQATIFSALFIVLGLPCSAAWLGFGAALSRLLGSQRALRRFNVAMGLVLAASVVLLV